MTTRTVARLMRSLLILALALLVVPATAMAATSPTTITINVVSARSLGCSPDSFTSPDLKVIVYVNGQQLFETLEASDNAAPEYGAVGTISVRLPATIGIEVQEAEPGGFFFMGESWLPCTTAPGGLLRANFTYDGAQTLRVDTKGDDSRAAEAVVVVGLDAPAAAKPVAGGIGVGSAHLSWSVDPRAVGDRVMAARVGAQIANVGLAGAYDWTGLCDNTAYAFRVLTDAEPWHVASSDVTFTTANAAPDPARVLEAWTSGKNVTVRWEWGAHDAARFDVLAGATPDGGMQARATSTATSASQSATATFARGSGDAYVRVKLTDTGGLTSLSDAFAIGAANQTATFPSPADSCGRASSPPPTTTQPTPATTTPTAQPTAQPPSTITPTQPVFPGQNDSDEFSFAMDQEIVLEPRARFAPINMTVGNANEMRMQNVVLDVTIGAGFQAQDTSILVPPGHAQNASIYASVLENVTIGRHAFRVDAVNGAVRHVLHGNITVSLPPIADPAPTFPHALLVKATPENVTIAPGGTTRATIRLTNVGQTAVEARGMAFFFVDDTHPAIDLAARDTGAPGWSADLDAQQVNLSVGQSTTYTLTIHAPANASLGLRAILTVGGTWNASGNQNIPEATSMNITVQSAAAVSGRYRISSVGVAAIAGAGVGGLALGLGLLLRREKWRLLLLGPFFALYTRLAAPHLLHHESRDALHKLILQRPGIRYAELKRETGFPNGALVHHLRALECGRLVVGRSDAGQKRYYPPGVAAAQPAVTAAQQRVLDLLHDGPLSQADLAARLGVTQQAANAHVKTLERSGRVMIERDARGATLVHKVVEVTLVE